MDRRAHISTPLEADSSLLDAHKLPSYLGPALEFISRRLAMKGLHVTLVVARRDYQLPGLVAARVDAIMPTYVPVTNLLTLPSPPDSPASPEDVVACGPRFSTIKSLVGRSRSQRDKVDFRQPSRLSRKPSLASLLEGPRLRRAATASATASHVSPRTPATPATSVVITSSSSSPSFHAGSTTSAASIDLREPEIRLLHTTPLNPRAYRLVADTLTRATKKFDLATPLTAHEPSAYGIPPLVLHSSILQNESLHSSEGLTLLSLDHLYTFKAALARYAAVRSEFGSHFRLEDAVDELRRYVMSAGGRRRLLKSTLASAYDWLGPLNEAALGEVMRTYSRAYGSATETGVEDDLVKRDHIPALAATMALAKIVNESAEMKKSTVESLSEAQPQPAARLSNMTIKSVAHQPPTLAILPQDSFLQSPSEYSPTPVMASSASVQHKQLLSPMSAQNWIVQDYSPWADEGMVTMPDTPPSETLAKIHETKQDVDQPVENLLVVAMAKDDVTANVSDLAASSQAAQLPKTPTNPPKALPQAPSAPAAAVTAAAAAAASSSSSPKIPSPRTSPKASPPALRLQTSFPTPFKPTSQRKKTPMAQKRRPTRRGTSFDILPPAVPVSPTVKDIRIEIVISDSDEEEEYEEENEKEEEEEEEEEEANLTDFEDAELTARSPVKTPGGSMWLNIDDILGSYERPRGALEKRHHQSYHHSRKSSSLHEMQTPAGDRLGPMTPNGYDDISPITRGEWGFLMISDQFRTKTAAVSCV
ncbi:hypothetical protein M406DRAFT_325571 [Cryphonectria parasitica EP155]|uniref:DUF7582 domain-containing protein n=1 Tax=Cryphonectria parasitica (strain ATCC 38755 / EP155) TaxID=660469 RepID=A0A9P5CTW0_CRYP1|nr:uncharacterized protein M406DRAFT_325571 [Cryphonectria parasitica EP155]KAF3770102.1 hypothetical protein M406DRAFT_325571 [Cryphonectria parasitica EP155]